MITFNNVEKLYGSQTIFEGLTFALNPTYRIGLIGPNGSGKTTLLRLIAAQDEPTNGSVDIPSDLTLGYLPQEVEVLAERTPLEIVLEPFSHVVEYDKEMEKITDQMADSVDGDHRHALRQMHLLQTQVEIHDAFTLAPRAKSILAGLGVPQEAWEKPVSLLSGGFKMRVALAQLLLCAPKLLLLDEPTNHLDMDSLIWLEKFLQQRRCGMVIVSHDRDFLNRMIDHTAELHDHRIVMYRGNYDAFCQQRDMAESSSVNAVKNIEREINQIQVFVDRFRAQATKASQVQSRVKRIEELKAQIPTLRGGQKNIRFRFPVPVASGSVPLKADGVSAQYGDFKVFSNISLTIGRGDKIALIGPNGAGKTTFLKLLAAQLAPVTGSIITGHNTEIRYFGQHQLEQLNPDLNLIETIQRASGSTERKFVQSVLGAFLFSGATVEKKVGMLSGGEKSRLAFATILSKPGNVLLLDEPTNHLDMQSIEILMTALTEFEGTLIFVSHNERFISTIANRIVEMRRGLFRDFPGTLSDYRSYLDSLQGTVAAPAAAKKPGQTAATQAAQSRAEEHDKQDRIRKREELKNVQRKIERIEKQIQENEGRIEEQNMALHDAKNVSNYSLLNECTATIERLKKENESHMSDWERFSSKLERLS